MYSVTRHPYRTGNFIYGIAVKTDPCRIRYVGQTTDLQARLKAHRVSEANPSSPMQFWIRKHGRDSLVFYILEETSFEQLDSAESDWIKYLGTYIKESDYGLNCDLGGKGINSIGYSHSQGTKDSLSKINQGEKSPTAILTEESVRRIRDLYFRDNLLQTEIAKMYGVSPSTIAGIIRRRKWRHLAANSYEIEYTGRRSEKAKLSPDQVREIRKRQSQGETVSSIAKEYDVYRNVIYGIWTGASYAWVI